MKNATRYCAGPAYYRMRSTDVYCSKQTGIAAPKETITHHFFVSELKKKTARVSQNLWRRSKNVVKTETQQTFVNGLLGFLLLRYLYSAGSVLSIIGELPIDIKSLSALLINILRVPSSCFCIVISLSEGEIIPFSGVCQSGRLHYPRRGGFTH